MRPPVLRMSPSAFSGAALDASRRLWRAGLGAAVVSRAWLEHEAGDVFRSLVKEGTAVEARALHALGQRLSTSRRRADAFLKHARGTLQGSVHEATASARALVRDTLSRTPQATEAKPSRKPRTGATKTARKTARKAAPASARRRAGSRG